MAKRARASSDQLTGGSLDVNPQYLNIGITTDTANGFKELLVNMPIIRGQPQDASHAYVVELLKVFCDMPELDQTNVAEVQYSATLNVCTRSFTTLQPFAVPQVFARFQRVIQKAFTAGGTYNTSYLDPMVYDLTDNSGHGVLVGGDNLFVHMQTANFLGPAVFQVKILYRLKRVALTEYIGIVQSQQ